MLVKNMRKLFKHFNYSVLIISFLTNLTAGKLDLLEKFVWFTICLIMDQVLDVFFKLFLNNFS